MLRRTPVLFRRRGRCPTADIRALQLPEVRKRAGSGTVLRTPAPLAEGLAQGLRAVRNQKFFARRPLRRGSPRRRRFHDSRRRLLHSRAVRRGKGLSVVREHGGTGARRPTTRTGGGRRGGHAIIIVMTSSAKEVLCWTGFPTEFVLLSTLTTCGLPHSVRGIAVGHFSKIGFSCEGSSAASTTVVGMVVLVDSRVRDDDIDIVAAIRSLAEDRRRKLKRREDFLCKRTFHCNFRRNRTVKTVRYF